MGLFSSTDYAGTLHWEKIDNKGDGRPQYVARAKVIGGWLISSIANAAVGGSSITFMPDPEHKWMASSQSTRSESNKAKTDAEKFEEEWYKRHGKN